ncbi:DUF6174 domain-containing protein [Arthrobacter castelli]|uniref:DUF6174 domain-containing protein n=1 Tax=Arthrobacter castelli TaxID=271431 RepID=UPI00040EA21B|nr:DUF6174 domain-containing protein [Arthrobacter castelli]
MKLIRSATLILALAAATGCSSVEVDARQAAMNQARELWKTESPEDYRFTWQFSIMAGQTRTVVTVHDGKATIGEPAGLRSRNELFLTRSGRSGTMEDVFKILEHELAEAHAVEVRYNSELGYPESVFVNDDPNMVDEESTFRILKLQEL